MHPYLPHLLSDIAAAHRTETPPEPVRQLSFEEEMEEIERWTEGEPEHTFGYYCGLETINFPPPEQLTGEELKLVCEALGRLLSSWNSGIDLPEKLPLPLRYKFMVNALDEGFTVVNSGFMHFDFCSGYAPDCVFKEYCSCLEFWNELPDEDMNIDSLNEDDLPF